MSLIVLWISETLNTLTTIEPINTTNTINKIVFVWQEREVSCYWAISVAGYRYECGVWHDPQASAAFAQDWNSLPARATHTIFCPDPTHRAGAYKLLYVDQNCCLLFNYFFLYTASIYEYTFYRSRLVPTSPTPITGPAYTFIEKVMQGSTLRDATRDHHLWGFPLFHP